MEPVKLAYDLHLPKTDSGLCPIITMHGLYMNKLLLNKMAEHICMETGRKVYCVDLRNHGESPSPTESNAYLMAEDLHLFLTDHGIPKATFVGHSFSSRSATVFAIDYPDKVEKLVFIDFFPYADMDKTYSEFTSNVTNAIRAITDNVDMSLTTEEIKVKLNKQLSEDKQTAWIFPFLELLLNETVKDEQGLRLRYDRDQTLKFFLEGRYRLPPYGAYDGPLLCLIAEKSRFYRNINAKGEDELKKYFPRAECVTIKDATHMMPIEKPDELAHEIRKFLEKC